LTIFWITSLGSIVQLVIMALASWLIFSGVHSFSDLNFDVFITQYVPIFIWVKGFLVALLGDIGRWILSIPVLILGPVKLVLGIIIGQWAYSAAKSMPVKPGVD